MINTEFFARHSYFFCYFESKTISQLIKKLIGSISNYCVVWGLWWFYPRKRKSRDTNSKFHLHLKLRVFLLFPIIRVGGAQALIHPFDLPQVYCTKFSFYVLPLPSLSVCLSVPFHVSLFFSSRSDGILYVYSLSLSLSISSKKKCGYLLQLLELSTRYGASYSFDLLLLHLLS